MIESLLPTQVIAFTALMNKIEGGGAEATIPVEVDSKYRGDHEQQQYASGQQQEDQGVKGGPRYRGP